MGERTAAEVLAEKLKDGMIVTYVDSLGSFASGRHLDAVAARLAEDPAITVRTDLVVDRYLVEIHHAHQMNPWAPEEVFQTLTGPLAFANNPDHRIAVRPYPEVSS